MFYNKHDISSEDLNPHINAKHCTVFPSSKYCSHAMPVHRVVYFGAFAAVLASYSGNYLDAFKGVAISACVVINLYHLLLNFFYKFLARIVQHLLHL